MSHPIHDLLLRWLGTEQCAFNADTTVYDNYWPSERLPVVPDFGEIDEPEPES
jgi:hypothetical protein